MPQCLAFSTAPSDPGADSDGWLNHPEKRHTNQQANNVAKALVTEV